MNKLAMTLMGILILTTSTALAAPTEDRGQHSAKAQNMEKPMSRERKEVREQERRQDGAKSSERSKEMTERNQERKEIKQAYKQGDAKTKGKKPWWKFWGSEQDS